VRQADRGKSKRRLKTTPVLGLKSQTPTPKSAQLASRAPARDGTRDNECRRRARVHNAGQGSRPLGTRITQSDLVLSQLLSPMSGALSAPDRRESSVFATRLRFWLLTWEDLSVGSNALDLHLLAANLILDCFYMICADLLQRHFFDNSRGFIHQSVLGGLDD